MIASLYQRESIALPCRFTIRNLLQAMLRYQADAERRRSQEEELSCSMRIAVRGSEEEPLASRPSSPDRCHHTSVHHYSRPPSKSLPRELQCGNFVVAQA